MRRAREPVSSPRRPPGTPTARGAPRLVEAIADQHQLGPARPVSPRLAMRQLGAHPRALDEAAPVVARQVDEALRADQPLAQPLDHREHALAHQRRVVAERDRRQLSAVVVVVVRVPACAPAPRLALAVPALGPRPQRPRLHHPRRHRARARLVAREPRALGLRRDRVEPRVALAHRRRRRAVELRQQHPVRARRLLARLLAPLERRARRLRVDHAHHPRRQDPLAHRLRHAHQPVEDRRRLGDPRRLEHDLVRRRAVHDVRDPVPQVVLDIELAAHAPARQLEHVAAAPHDQLGVDRDPPQLVDQDRDPPPVLRASIRLSAVVLPAPSQPVRIVNGTRADTARSAPE